MEWFPPFQYLYDGKKQTGSQTISDKDCKRSVSMKTEAIKVENGFLIPMNDVLRSIKKDKILVKLEIVDPPGEVDYSPSTISSACVKHINRMHP